MKEEFVRKIKEDLVIFEDDVLASEIKIYTDIIDRKIAEGNKEEDVIKALGNPQEIKKKILKKHGINPDKVLVKKSFVAQKFEELFDAIHHVVEVMSKNTFKENIKIILDLLVLLIFIGLLKAPFILVRNLGDSLLSYIDIPLLTDIWGVIVDIIYIIVALIVFMNIFTKWFKNLKVNKKEQKIKTKELESVTLNKPKE